MNGGSGTIVVDFDVTVLVTFEETVTTLVALLSYATGHALAAHLTDSAAAKMLRNERVIIKHMQLGSLLPPPAFLRQTQWNEIMFLDAIFDGFEYEVTSFVDVGARAGCAQTARFADAAAPTGLESIARVQT